MKFNNTIFILSFFILFFMKSFTMQAAFNYYNYIETVLPPGFSSNASATSMCTDEEGTIYYIDDKNQIIAATKIAGFWRSDVIYTNSKMKADPHSSLIYKTNGQFKQLFFIGIDGFKDGYVCRIIFRLEPKNVNNEFEFPSVSWSFQQLTILPINGGGTKLVVDRNNKVFFIDSQQHIIGLFERQPNTFWEGFDLHFMIPSAPLVLNQSSLLSDIDKIFYIDINRHIQYFYAEDTTYHWFVASVNNNIVVQNNTSLGVDWLCRLYYTDVSGSLAMATPPHLSCETCRCILPVGTYIWTPTILNDYAPKSVNNANGGFVLYQNEIYYFDENKKMVVMYWDKLREAWSWWNLCPNAASVMNNSNFLADNNKRLYYFGEDHVLRYLTSGIHSDHQYVYIKGNDLMYQDATFNPKILNYTVTVYENNLDSMIVGPWFYYYVGKRTAIIDQSDGLIQIDTQLRQIKRMGFDAIRLWGFEIGGTMFFPNGNPDPWTKTNWICDDSPDCKLSFLHCKFNHQGFTGNDYVYCNDCENITHREKYFKLLKYVLQKADSAKLKVILVAGNFLGDGIQPVDSTIWIAYSEYLKKLTGHFGDHPEILSFDLWNEPANNGTRGQSMFFSKMWNDSIREVNNHHLTTIGLYAGHNDVYHWDPALLDVDFISYHLYPKYTRWDAKPKGSSENAVNRTYKDLYWIHRNFDRIHKPWIVGENGFLSDTNQYFPQLVDAWGTELDQANFTDTVMRKTFGCGGSGYSYYSLKDVPGWEMGLQTIDTIPRPKQIISDTSNIFQELNFTFCDCKIPDRYFDYWDIDDPVQFDTNYFYYGIVIDALGKPISDAVVTEYPWTDIKTFTQDNGSFLFHAGEEKPLEVLHVVAPGYGYCKYFGLSKYNPGPNTILFIDTIMLSRFDPLNQNGCIKELDSPPAWKAFDSFLNTGVYPVHPQTKTKNSMKVYPNPTDGTLEIVVNDVYEVVSISLCNLFQEEVFTRTYKMANSVSMDISNLVSGVYFVNLSTSTKNFRAKVIKL